MSTSPALAVRIRRDRAWVLAASAALLLASWSYLLRMPAHGVTGVAGAARSLHDLAAHMAAPHAARFAPETLAITFLMWLAMLVGMMLPVVLPWILVLAESSRARSPALAPHPSVLGFAAGYLSIWSIYSLLGASLQLLLQQQGRLDAGLATGRAAGAALLVAAGLFQLSPWKEACLAHCRSPLGFFLERWHEGPGGGVRMGFRHGLCCVACCWALMALMFAAGVMNLAWMAVLALVMLAEQIAPRRWQLAPVFGVVLLVWGLALALAPRG